MALHIRDAKAEELVREMARLRNIGLTEVIRDVFDAALKEEQRKIPLKERLAPIQAQIASWPDTGVELNKQFYDDLWGEEDLRGGEA